MSAAVAIPRITICPPGPERPELTSEFFDRHLSTVGRKMPISAEYNGDDFSSPGIDHSDYSRMHQQQRKQSGERRLPTPAFALRPDLLRQVIVHYIERRAHFRKPMPGSERERLARANQANADRCKFDEEVLRNLCARFVALKKSNADPAALAKLKIQIENLDTRLRIGRNIAGIVLRVSHLYYCVGLDSVGVAAEVGLKPPHVRALIWKLNWIWDLLNGKAKPRYEYKKKRTRGPNIGRQPFPEHRRFNVAKAVKMHKAGKSVYAIAIALGYKPGEGNNRTRNALIKAGVYKPKWRRS